MVNGENVKFHILTIGWNDYLVGNLANPIKDRSGYRFSHVVHPRYTPECWPCRSIQPGLHFFCEKMNQSMPKIDRRLLASIERADTPTVHNMILSDRVVSKLPYEDALGYATFLARRLIEILNEIKPTAVIVAFDSLHGSMALAVAKHLRIPVFALHFSAIPLGHACFCDRMSPAGRVKIVDNARNDLHELAEATLRKFENRETRAVAYIAPAPRSFYQHVVHLPARFWVVYRMVKRIRNLGIRKFTDSRNSYSFRSALTFLTRKQLARWGLSKIATHSHPPSTPYVLFGFHMQPESSIDVWAPFFSNQMWVVELLSRCLPPTHSLLIKIHKSDTSNYSRKKLQQLGDLPGVEFVAPFADSRSFIEKSDLVVAIQGTMGLEAALIGKPVIMLGESPVTCFPSAAAAGSLHDLPSLVRSKLRASRPSRQEIINAYMEYLAPLFPASSNDWSVSPDRHQIDDYVRMFKALESYLATSISGPKESDRATQLG